MVVLTSLAGTCVPSGYVAKVSVSALAPPQNQRQVDSNPMLLSGAIPTVAKRYQRVGDQSLGYGLSKSSICSLAVGFGFLMRSGLPTTPRT
jgi:hypothetical protein